MGKKKRKKSNKKDNKKELTFKELLEIIALIVGIAAAIKELLG